MMHWRVKAVLRGTVMCCAMFQIEPSFAQDTAQGSQQTGQLEEVVVTATRREANLQDVPISIIALTGDDLLRDQVTEIQALTKFAPNLVFRTGQSPFEQNLSMRGVGGIKPVPTVDPPVGYYLDGVYNVLDQGSYNMIDMERVEVLEGPQGTLFGRNTVGGAVSVTTNKPVYKTEGSFTADLGNFGAQTYTVIGNFPVVDGKVATRLVYQYATNDGFGTNRTIDKPTASLAQNYVRGSLRFDPSDAWEVLFTGYWQKSTGWGWPALINYADPARAPSFVPYIATDMSFDIEYPFDNRFYLNTYGGIGTVTGKINDAVTFKSITGYTYTEYSNRQDMSAGSAAPIQWILAYPTFGTQLSQEFQLYGDLMDGRFTYIGGLYYGSLDANQVLYFRGAPYSRQNGPYANNKTYAGYAQASFAIVPSVRITAGLRYTQDQRDAAFHSYFQQPYNGPWQGAFIAAPVPGPFIACGLPLPAGADYFDQSQCHIEASSTYHYWPWTVGIDWKASDNALLYAKVSKSFRSGAYGNASPVYTPPGIPGYVELTQDEIDAKLAYFAPVEPSSLVSGEVGTKLDLLNHTLRLNAAVFYSNYKNIQANNTLPLACPLCGTFQQVVNSGEADIWGGELTITALIQNLELRGSLGIAKPKYTSGVYLGQKFSQISDTSYAVGASYPITTGSGTLTLTSNWSWHSAQQQFSETPTIPNYAFTQKAWGLLDARVSFQMANKPIELSLYGTNLLDEHWFNSAVPNGSGWVTAFPSAPRQYGAAIAYRF